MARIRIRAYAAVLIATALLVAGCDADDAGPDEAIEGSGNIASESREVIGFGEVVLLASGEVTVDVTGTESLTIEADDNILPLLTAEVRGGRLELGVRTDISATTITWRVTADDLTALALLGGGNIAASGVDAGAFEVTIGGGGDVQASGTATELSVEIRGAGHFGGEALAASDGSVLISGAGSAVVNVADELAVSIPGSGTVEYVGSPALTTDIPGSGRVSPR